MNCWLVKNVIKRWSSSQSIRYQDVVGRSVSDFLNNFFGGGGGWGVGSFLDSLFATTNSLKKY